MFLILLGQYFGFMFRELKRLSLLLIILLHGLSASSQSLHFTEKDLKPEWKHFVNGQYIAASALDERPVYFLLNRNEIAGQKIWIKGKYPITLFVNHKLVSQGNTQLVLSIDSMAKIYSNQLLFAVQSNHYFTTKLLRLSDKDDHLFALRKKADFRDFVILVSLVLIIFLTALLYANPKLTFDYFNVIKFLSIQEREENLTAIRTTSSINFVYYFFTALLFSFLIIALFQQSDFADQFDLLSVASLGGAIFNLTKLTLITFTIMMLKLIGVSGLARLFNIREVTNFQYFNFIRMTLIAAVLMAIISVIYFMSGVINPNLYFWILIIGFSIIALGTAFLFLKLLPRTDFQFFHLFSYLCASEIIPFMILIKVLFK